MDGGNNLIEDTGNNACGLTNGTNGSLIGFDPLLAPLGDYGGPSSGSGQATQTHALLPGSPAIDVGDNAACDSSDQRGQSRGDWACDIGAYEMQFADSDTVSKTVSSGSSYTFGPTLAKVAVVDDGGCLTGLSIQRQNLDHPQAAAARLQTGVNWTLSPVGCSSGFTVTLTLPTPYFTPNANSKLCRWDTTGSSWDCDQSSDNTAATGTMADGPIIDVVARQNVNAFSQWTVGNSVGPTAVTLQSFSASRTETAVWLVLLSLMVGLGMVVYGRRRRKM